MALITFICQTSLKFFFLYIIKVIVVLSVSATFLKFYLSILKCNVQRPTSTISSSCHSLPNQRELLVHVRGTLHQAGTTEIIAARVRVWCSIAACPVNCHMQCIGKLDFLEILLLLLALPICLSNKYPSIYIYGFSILLTWPTKWWAIHLDLICFHFIFLHTDYIHCDSCK